MPSTYSPSLKIELIAVGEQPNAWGSTTNNNFQYAIEQAITGYTDATFPSDANYDWAATYVNSNSAQEARNLVIRVVGTITAQRDFIVPTLEKEYIIFNATTGAQSILVKTSGGSGVIIPNGKRMHVFVDGTNVVQMDDYDVTRTIGSLTLSTALPIASGGTGNTTANAALNALLPAQASNNGKYLTTDGTNTSWATVSGVTSFSAGTTGFTPSTTTTGAITLAGTLAIANGGTGQTTANAALNALLPSQSTNTGKYLTTNGTDSSWATLNAVTSFSAGTTGFTPSTGTTGTVTLAGTLATTNGGTGLTAFTANQLFYASSTSAIAQSTNAQFNGTTLTLANDASIATLRVGRGLGNQTTNTAIGVETLNSIVGGTNNTAVGYQVLKSATSGSSNTAIGVSALQNNETNSNSTAVGWYAMTYMRGNNNTAAGYQALRGSAVPASNTGTDNVAIGYNSQRDITSGSNNISIGSSALSENTTGAQNIAIGGGALTNLLTASSNIAIGYWAGYRIRGNSNIALGQLALYGSSTPANNTGVLNIAIGGSSLSNITSADYNVAIGGGALQGITTGASNVAVGSSAGSNGLTFTESTYVGHYASIYNAGSNNTAVGAYAMQGAYPGGVSTAANTVAIGHNALTAIETGTVNTAVGYGAGSLITTGSKNTIIGAYNGNQGGLDIRTASNYIVLSDGDGNPRAYWNGANATFGGDLTLTGGLTTSTYLRTAVGTVASSSTITPTSDTCNQYNVTALAVPATFAAPSGTPVDGQKLLLRIKDNGTARALTWNAAYRVVGTVLPTTTVATKTTYVGCVYNSADAVWDVVAVTTQV